MSDTIKYWAYNINSKYTDDEFIEASNVQPTTYSECYSKAESECETLMDEDHHDVKNGDTVDFECEFVEFSHTDDGETIIYQRIAEIITIEAYHGDLAEHGYP